MKKKKLFRNEADRLVIINLIIVTIAELIIPGDIRILALPYFIGQALCLLLLKLLKINKV